jgi:hypothetical protein
MRYAIAIAICASCVPDLDQRTSIVDRTEILAVVAEPAEAPAGASVQYHALVATPDGEAIAPVLSWAYCTKPKPPIEDDAVSTACLDDPGVAIAGAGADATGTIPMTTCTLFGPNPPGPGFRPRDPDPTGGFYQPVRVQGEGALTFGLDRIACALANAPPDVVAEFRARYHANQNPPALALTSGGANVDGLTADAGATIELHAAWPAGAAEPYVSYDPASVSLVDRSESLRVSFYATAGRFGTDTAGIAEGDPSLSVDDTWTAPGPRGPSGPVTLWTVFRDSRGGATIARYSITIR